MTPVIYGKNLAQVVDIEIYLDTQVDDRVDVAIREGGTDDQLPIRVTVMEHALTGERTLAVISESGTGTASVTVLSTEGTKIRAVTPRSGRAGRGQPIAVRISGDNLEDGTDVTFLHDGQPDKHITATVLATEADYVDSDVSISVNAAFGRRTLSVATTSEEVHSPPGVSFTVLPGVIALGIMLLTLITAVIHITLTFPSTLFILNGIGYLVLLAALYTPTPQLILSWRPTIRWVLIAYTLLTIVIWIATGYRGTGAYITKLVEVLLVILLLVESRKA